MQTEIPCQASLDIHVFGLAVTNGMVFLSKATSSCGVDSLRVWLQVNDDAPFTVSLHDCRREPILRVSRTGFILKQSLSLRCCSCLSFAKLFVKAQTPMEPRNSMRNRVVLHQIVCLVATSLKGQATRCDKFIQCIQFNTFKRKGMPHKADTTKHLQN